MPAAQGPAAAHPPRRPAAIVLTVVLPFGCGYYLSYLFRTVNAVISPQLVAEAGLDAADLGFLTSVYFFTFAAIQLPLGVALDRYGPRRVQAVLLLVAALGAAVFASGSDLASLTAGRGLIGLGVAGCLMGALKANAIWWPKDRLPLFNNVILAFGGFGALSATTPVEALLQVADWRDLFAALAAASALVASIVFFVVPEREGSAGAPVRMAGQVAAIRAILSDAFFWRFGSLFFVSHAVFLAYQALWAAPWLRDVAGFDRGGVADHLLLLQSGMFVGVLSFGIVADRLRNVGIGPEAVFAVGAAIFLVVQLPLAFGVTRAAGLLWALYGIFGTATLLSFSIFAQHFPQAVIGRVTTTANLMGFVCAFAFQWAIGAIIHRYPQTPDGYDPRGNEAAFLAMLALQVAAFVWFAWPRRGGRAPRR